MGMDARTFYNTPTPRAERPQTPRGADPGCRQCRQCGNLALLYPFYLAGERWKWDYARPNRPGERSTWTRAAVECLATCDPTDDLDDGHICAAWCLP